MLIDPEARYVKSHERAPKDGVLLAAGLVGRWMQTHIADFLKLEHKGEQATLFGNDTPWPNL